MKKSESVEPPVRHGTIADFLAEVNRDLQALRSSQSPRDLITCVYALERLKFLVKQQGIASGSETIDLQGLENQVDSIFETGTARARRLVSKEYLALTKRHTRAVESAERELRRGVLIQRRDALEFDHEVLYLRDVLEYTRGPLARLGFQDTVSSSLSTLAKVDSRLRNLLEGALPLYYRLVDYTAPEPNLFPAEFWWRTIAWQCYLPFSSVDES